MRRQQIEDLERALQAVPGIQKVAVVVQQQEQRVSAIRSGRKLAHDKRSQESRPADARENAETVEARPPAICYGGELLFGPEDPRTLQEALIRASKEANSKGIRYILPDGTESFQSYPQLLEAAQRILTGLRKLGVQPMDPVLFQFSSNQNFISAFWACVLGGFLPTPLAVAPSYTELNASVSKLINIWSFLGEPVILTDAKLLSVLRDVSHFAPGASLCVEAVEVLLQNDQDDEWYPCTPDSLVLHLLTSGSTGTPKCVQHKHTSIIALSKGNAVWGNMTTDDIVLNWVPLDHVGGLVFFHIRDLYRCCQQINAKVESFIGNPLLWLDLIHKYKVTITWAPNFAFALVNDRAEEIGQRRWDLSSIRLWFNGGEAVNAHTVYRFLRLLEPHWLAADAIHPAWGMSETASATIFGSLLRDDETAGIQIVDKHSLSGKRLRHVSADHPDAVVFTEVGAPIPGVWFRVVDQANQLLPEDSVGRIQTKGPTIMAGYYNNPAANAEVFVGEGWFNTGDLGFIQNGHLTITGREKDIIVINGANYPNHEIEAIVEEVPGVEVTYAAACGIYDPHAVRDLLVIFFVPTTDDPEKTLHIIQFINSAVARRLGLRPDMVIPVDRSEFPKTAKGTAQRSQLSKELQQGRYAEVLRAIETAMSAESAGPDGELSSWVYEPSWEQSEIGSSLEAVPSGTYLLFTDGSALGETLESRLRSDGRNVVCVRPAREFAQLDGSTFQIDPRSQTDYHRLLHTVTGEPVQIGGVIHHWAYPTSGAPSTVEALTDAQYSGVFSLLFLMQALVRVNLTAVQLAVVTTAAQFVGATDPPLEYQKSTLPGFLKTIPAEFAETSVCHIDLDTGDRENHPAQVLAEFRSQAPYAEIAYRGGRRFIRKLREVVLEAENPGKPVLQQGGIYLMTGGLGDIGFELAQYLLSTYRLKLVFLGRSPLREGDQSTRALRYQDLCDFGETLYIQADVSIPEEVSKAIQTAEERWQGKLAGVMHLAGENMEQYFGALEQQAIQSASVESFLSHFRAKVFGTWALQQALKHHADADLILFSSVNGFFGGSAFGAYSAANSFVDGVALHERAQGRRPVISLAWSMWENLGMNRRNPAVEAALYKGFRSIPANQGLGLFLACLSLNRPWLLIGLDGTNAHIRPLIAGRPPLRPVFYAYFTAEHENFAVAALRKALNGIGVDSDSDWQFSQLRDMPVNECGEINRDLLPKTQTKRIDYVEPGTALEKVVAAMWTETLKVKRAGVNDSFFALGGSSLNAMRLLARLNEHFSLEAPLKLVYDNPTLGEMARGLELLLEPPR